MPRPRSDARSPEPIDVASLREAMVGARSVSAVARALGLPATGTSIRRVRAACAAHGVETTALIGTRGPRPATLDAEAVRKAVAASTSMSEVLRILGRPRQAKWFGRVRAIAVELAIPVEHLNVDAVRRAHGFARSRYTPPDELFTKGVRRSGINLARRMIRDLGAVYACYKCGNSGVWCGEPLTLAVDHVNGDDTDNRAENLRFACPNCHTQTPTWGRKKRAVGERVPPPYVPFGRAGRAPVSSAGSRTAPRRRAARPRRSS